MRLMIVRHADAGDRDEFAASGRPDQERPLSAKGHDQLRVLAPRLRALVPDVDQIVTSPYARARETAEILRKEYGGRPLAETESLEPDVPPGAFVRYLRGLAVDTVVCVGHEPHLGELAGWLTTGERASFMKLGKGAACLIRFKGPPKRGAGELRWLFGPKELAM